MPSPCLRVAWWGKHFGEEPPLVGAPEQGAGTIFFGGCDLRCVFCQNHQISQTRVGSLLDERALLEVIFTLQDQGVCCLDLVTPSIWWRPLADALRTARRDGLRLPVVWNCHGHEPLRVLTALEGLVDVYLPDFKYGSADVGWRYSRARNYPDQAERALREMLRQVGPLRCDEHGVATRGVIVRHLVLPGNLPSTWEVLRRLASIDPGLHLSLMSQYLPLHRADEFPELARTLTPEEWAQALAWLEEFGFEEGWIQDPCSAPDFVPDFCSSSPFETGQKGPY